ncbi:MAG: hypothetical protein ABIH46_10070, partial [Chloroflexota bacterium]
MQSARLEEALMSLGKEAGAGDEFLGGSVTEVAAKLGLAKDSEEFHDLIRALAKSGRLRTASFREAQKNIQVVQPGLFDTNYVTGKQVPRTYAVGVLHIQPSPTRVLKPAVPSILERPVAAGPAVQPGMGIGEAPTQGQLLPEYRGAAVEGPGLVDVEAMQARAARQAEIAAGQAEMPGLGAVPEVPPARGAAEAGARAAPEEAAAVRTAAETPPIPPPDLPPTALMPEDEADDIIRRFAKALASPETQKAFQETTALRATEQGRRIRLVTIRKNELIAEGVTPEVAIKLARKELAGPLPVVKTGLEAMATEPIKEALYAKIAHELDDWKMVATHQALANALTGRAIPDIPGTAGGSAYKLLTDIFPKEIVESLGKVDEFSSVRVPRQGLPIEPWDHPKQEWFPAKQTPLLSESPLELAGQKLGWGQERPWKPPVHVELKPLAFNQLENQILEVENFLSTATRNDAGRFATELERLLVGWDDIAPHATWEQKRDFFTGMERLKVMWAEVEKPTLGGNVLRVPSPQAVRSRAQAREYLAREAFDAVPGSPTDTAAAVYWRTGNYDDFIEGMRTSPAGPFPVLQGFDEAAFAEVGKVSGRFADPTRLIQAIDKGEFGGALQRAVLWPTRRTTQASLKFGDTAKGQFQKILTQYDMLGFQAKRLRELAGDVVEHISLNDVDGSVDSLLAQTPIRDLVKGLSPANQKRVVGFARDTRRFLDDVLVMQNRARIARGQKTLQYQSKYRSWIR